MDATSFKARLDASKAILAATRGRPNADAILANERKELLATLDGMEVSGMSAAQAIQDIKASGLPGEDEEILISRIAELLCAPREARITSGGSSRGGCHNQGLVFQDFSTIPNFIPMVVWESCRHTQSGVPILKTAVALGLRRPTEPTKRVIAMTIICATRGVEATQLVDGETRTQFVKSLKPQIKEIARYAGPHAVFSNGFRKIPRL